jgi:hypothetical protein
MRLLLFKPFALGAKSIDVIQHSIQQGLGRSGWDAGTLQLPDLAALPMNLNPHTFDFAPNEFDVRHRQSPLVKSRYQQ